MYSRLAAQSANGAGTAASSGSAAATSATKSSGRGFKSIGLSVDPDSDASVSSSDDEDEDVGHHEKHDNFVLESAKFMRNITKVTNEINFFDDGDEDADFGVGDGAAHSSISPVRTAKGGSSSAADEFMASLDNFEVDLDVDFDERGKIVSKARPADALDGPPLSINRPAAEQGQVNDETYSDSDSDVSFGGNDAEAQGFGADGVPLEKYKALEEKLIALMKKTTAQKKDFKSIRREHRKASNEAKHLKMERDELEQEVEEYQIKYEEALLKVGTGGGGGGGGGGAGGAALEEQRRKQREEARKALFAGGDEDDDVDFHVKLEDINFIKEIIIRITKYINKKMPLAADIRTVQGHFGSSVASFFSFYRWIIVTNVYAAVICIIFLILHMYRLYNTEYANTWSFYVLLPGFMAISSYPPEDQYQYLAITLLLPSILFFDAIRKWVHEDGNSKVINSIESEQENIKFAKQFLCCWDHSLTLATDVEDLQCTIGSNMTTMIQVDKEKGKTLERTFNEKVKMNMRRSFGLLIYTVMLVASWATIIFLTAQQNVLGKQLAENFEGASYVASSIVPGCVTAINSLLPILIEKITQFESWDSEKTVIKVLLIKMYLAKILNVLIQFASYLLLADPVFFSSSSNKFFGFETGNENLARATIRTNVEVQFTPETFNCRLDQVAAGLLQLLTVDFVVSKVIASVLPYANMAKAKLLKGTFKKEEFTVAKKMVNLLYFQGLVFLVLPYAPLATIIILMFQFLTFKFEKMMLFKFGTKPKKEWKAQDAGAFFIKFYLITIVVTGLLSTYIFVSSTTFAKSEKQLVESVTYCTELETVTDACTVYTLERLQNISKYKCGPFVNETSAWAMVSTDISSFGLISQITYEIGVNVIIVWFLVLFFYLKYSFADNSLGVANSAINEKERAFESSALASETKIRKLTKEVAKYKNMADL